MTNPTSETEEERAEREAAGLAPGEEWQGWWERCWFCPHALKTVDENVAGVCTTCQAQGLVFPTRPAVPPEQRVAEARATLERLVRAEIAARRERGKEADDGEGGIAPCHS